VARNVAWGIDIGDSAVKAVKLRRVGDSVVIQDYRTIPCETRPEEASSSDKEYRVRSALVTLLREVKLKGATVVVSMPGRDVFPRFIPLPPVEKKRIPEIVRYEAKTQMPFPIEEVIWDYQPISGAVGPGEETEVALFAIKKATVYGFLTNLQLAHLNPDIVEITPLALYNFLMHDRSIEVGTVVIDVGSGNTDLVIIDGDRFWTRSVSISGNDITRALQEKYQISFEEAENLKRKAATSKQADKLFGAMRPILDDLIGEIQRSIGYYKAQTRNVRIEKVILLGNAFKLHGLVDYFRKGLDYEVTLLDSLQRVKIGPGADAAKFEPELPNYGVAIGLALQGLGLARVSIDMMPEDIVRARIVKKKVPYGAAAVALLALPLLFGFRSANRDLERCETQIAPIEADIRRLNDQLNREKEAANLDPMATQLKEWSAVGEGRLEWHQFLNCVNGIFSKLDRGRFLLATVSKRDPTPGAQAEAKGKEAKEAPGLTGYVMFTRTRNPSTEDVHELLKAFGEQKPFVRDVSLHRSFQEEKDVEGVRRWVIVVKVRFDSKPARTEESAAPK